MLVGATILFSLTIVCLTVTQSLVWTLWVLIPILLFLSIFGYKKKILSQIIIMFFTATLSTFAATWIAFSWYNKNIFLPSQTLIQSNNGYTTIVATGTIIEKQTHNRYLRKSFNDVPFFLYTSRKHAPGDEILLTARVQPAITSELSLFSDHDAKRDKFISQWSDYSFDFASRQVMKKVAGSLHESNSILVSTSEISLIDQRKSSIQSSNTTAYTNNRTQ